MKYQIGDLLLVKHCQYKLRGRCNLHPRLYARLHPRFPLNSRPELFNSFGIVTQTINHSDAWEGLSTSDENIYIWFSQVYGKEYYFYEDEVIGEII